MDVRALRVEALVRVGGVVDHLELAVAVEEAVATLHVPLVVLLLVPELSVVAGRKLIQGFHEDMRGYRQMCWPLVAGELSPSDRTQPTANHMSRTITRIRRLISYYVSLVCPI